MNRTVLDVLIYLFEHCIDDEVDLDAQQDTIQSELRSAGFDDAQVDKAFEWLEGLAFQREDGSELRPAGDHSFRVFAEQETRKLAPECRGFLYFLDQIGVLDSANREMVLDRLMALETAEIDLEQLKWVILMVLFNRPGEEDSFLWIEDLVLDELQGRLH